MSADEPGGLKQAIDVAWGICNQFKTQDAEQAAFAEFMRHTAVVLGGVQEHALPELAAPIVEELNANLNEAGEQMTRYLGHKRAKCFLHMRIERKNLASIMHAVEQYLPLLSISVAAPDRRDAAMCDLQDRIVSLQGDSAEAALQLGRLKAVADKLQQHTADSMHLHHIEIRDMQQQMEDIRNKSNELDETEVGKVLEGCAAMHQAFGVEVADRLQVSSRQVLKMMVALEDIQEAQETSLDKQTILIENEDMMMACMARLETYMEQFISRSDIRSDRIRKALNVLCGSDSLHSHGSPGPITRDDMTKAMQQAICSGRLQISACLILGVPLMKGGPLRPVMLPCCRLAVSRAGAEECFRGPDPTCQLCNSRLLQNSIGEFAQHGAMELALLAEEQGVLPRLISTSDITFGQQSGSGSASEGTTFIGHLGKKPVAVKVVKLAAAGSKTKEIARLRQALTASYLAGLESSHVCKLEGYCWTDTGAGPCADRQLWLATELCHGTLVHLVQHASTGLGLPPADVASLGVMLCCALDGVHRGARSLHLDVNPANVLVKLPSDEPVESSQRAMAGDVVRGAVVKLAHLSLSHLSAGGLVLRTSTNLNPQQLRSVPGSAGYAAPEQMHGRACRRSNVFSVGAILLYAATAKHPYNNACWEGVAGMFQRGEHMEVPHTIEPPCLRNLIVQLTLLDVTQRPTLKTAESVLRGIYMDLTKRGQLPVYLARAREPYIHVPEPYLQHGGSFTANRAAACLADSSPTGPPVPQVSTVISKPHPEPGALAPAASGDRRPDELRPTTGAQRSPEAEHAFTSPHVRKAEELARWREGQQGEDPVSVDTAVRLKRLVGVKGVCTVEQLCEYLSRDDRDEAFSLRSAALPLTSTWPAAEGAPMLRPPVTTAVARQWMPEASLSSFRYVASVPNITATVADATLRLGSAGCILVPESSHIMLCNMTITGGLVLCQGNNSYLKLVNVLLNGCRLIVKDGAEAVLEDVALQNIGNAPTVVVSGRDTKLRADNVTIFADYGMLVERGASLTGEGVRVQEARAQGVCAKDIGTWLTLSNSHIHCTSRHALHCAAVNAANRACAALYKCTLTGFPEGVSIASDAVVILTGCTLNMVCASSSRVGVTVCVGCVLWEETTVLNTAGSWIRLVSVDPRVQDRLAMRVQQAAVIHADTRTVTDSVMCDVDGESIV